MKVICISGKAQNGKDTSANILKNIFDSKNKRCIIAHYADLLKYTCKTWFGWNGNKDNNGREILQRVGTDVVRKKKPDFWVDFIVSILELFPNEWDYVIIPDTRFPNELNKLKDSGYDVVHVRIYRNNFVSSLTQEQQNHISETALDNYTPDFIIENNTIDDLESELQQLAESL